MLREQIAMLQVDLAAAQEAAEAPRRGGGRTWLALGHRRDNSRGGHWDAGHGCGTRGGWVKKRASFPWCIHPGGRLT